MAGKLKNTKNTSLLLAQQRTELEKLKRESESLTGEALRAAEDRLLAQCIEITEGLMDFASLGFDPDGTEQVPAAWTQLSLEEKARKIRLAKYGCLPSSDIPHGAKLAHATMIGIIKARAQEKSGSKVFNMEVSMFPAPAPLEKAPDAIDTEFEVIDVD